MIDILQFPWRGLVAYLCVGSSVYKCLGALAKSHRFGGTHKGKNLLACFVGQPDVLWSMHSGLSHFVTSAGTFWGNCCPWSIE